MANEPSPSTGGVFSRETLDLLHRSLVAFLRTDSEDALRPALRRLAQEARANGVPPETVLVTLKAEWHAMPLAAGRADSSAGLRTRERVVTMCIKEYFR